ncbi:MULTISPECIES: N(4)-(beta-N-acetylglucosaminyl)-L-asparaginase [Pasteurellaceae]|uniref:N(4)-(Beta-N-acetylglucosaminyl)-L-asparaginase n=3 Tax=Histophilus somni TaxID=731 RepID=A0AAX2RXW0_HISSO|nr:N(4)-(beta-N-acetylglucosaminyl)-L-asparaginase [Histophilus somni]ACA32099.1 Asparaginase [Histophilus somni 2336]QEH08170.1 N(4)-(beta-N-acetylglucosaminyl)-L-asparaginase [Histophilus somni]QEH13252.1 N(4)-(beta-N-acetylglucosaminyl)-L-asparaginase [Histophilus somni]QEH24440.1 N(4)-(beta-N-acetylglucosaminyl)-L-asparaginase [Histophilus somni]QEH27732.1 N(4)-(beta-N-acetylglucosaminyl)-L-asparaginase [Histophilus somni]
MNNSRWGMIATWRMAFEGLCQAVELLKNKGSARDAILTAVTQVENYPLYKSVGYGGLPNEEGDVELDAAFMDGTSLALGAVAGLRNIANPILVAEALSHERFNSFLVGHGAEKWALKKGFPAKDMLTPRVKTFYEKRYQETLGRGLSPYSGHDTVGIIALDKNNNICVGTSTSGLFMKRHGRVGDSPISGSGFYADSHIGAATATGLGEDLMKGCTSYEIVRKMKEGMTPQQAADATINELEIRLLERYGTAGDLSVVCMNMQGEFGVSTNIDNFSFVVSTEQYNPIIYLAKRENGITQYEPASESWLQAYLDRIHGELK